MTNDDFIIVRVPSSMKVGLVTEAEREDITLSELVRRVLDSRHG